MAGFKVDDVEQVWHALAPPYEPLFAWLEGRAPKPDVSSAPVFRPLMLSHPLEDTDWAALDFAQFSAEWKWDGIRVQIVAGNGEAQLYSRTGDAVSQAFPDVVAGFNFDAVLDGELLVLRKGEPPPFNVAPFNDLQQRLNRKTVSKKQLEQFPAHIRLYDALAIAGEDLRALPFVERRARLEAWHAKVRPPRTDLSPLIEVADKQELQKLWAATRDTGIEGIMLKRRDSPYVAGRPKGLWFKWKRAPLTLDCVLMYAQRGSGKRSSYYSDYTFGTWRDGDERRSRAGPRRQGLLRLHRRGAAGDRPLGQEPHHRKLRPGARGRAWPGVRGRLRRRAEIDAPQVGRRHALPAHPPHPLGQARRRGRPPRHAGGDDRGLTPVIPELRVMLEACLPHNARSRDPAQRRWYCGA